MLIFLETLADNIKMLLIWVFFSLVFSSWCFVVWFSEASVFMMNNSSSLQSLEELYEHVCLTITSCNYFMKTKLLIKKLGWNRGSKKERCMEGETKLVVERFSYIFQIKNCVFWVQRQRVVWYFTLRAQSSESHWLAKKH